MCVYWTRKGGGGGEGEQDLTGQRGQFIMHSNAMQFIFDLGFLKRGKTFKCLLLRLKLLN